VGTVEGGMNINSVPDQAEVGIDIRTIPGQDHGSVRAGLQSYLGEEVEMDALVDVDAAWTDPHDVWMQEVFTIMAPLLGEELETRTATYFTDAAALIPAYGGPPTVILGPGEPHMAHQTDEYCVIQRIDQAVQAYLELARSWCGL
ncbi:MAG: M20/M25/M40 family metallo-hydrolase, partial [Rhodospirillales bacterium]